MKTRHALMAACLGLLSTGLTACSGGLTAPTPLSSAPPAAAMPGAPTLGWPAPTPPMAPPRLFGTVTEQTPEGPVAVEGVYIEYCGYDSAVTDANGFYQLVVPNGTAWLYVRSVPGFRDIAPVVTVHSDTRLDLRLERE